MEDVVSVIVPVYNVEQYIRKCIESILNQTYNKMEIILVDDGSTDNSGIICDEYSKRDKRIKVIHKINGGLSDARNAGLDICTGDYIVFVDSDDYIKNNMIEMLHKDILEKRADISVCSYFFDNDGNIKRKNISTEKFVTAGQEKFRYLYNEYYIITVVAWNKIYKRYIFEEIRYPKGKINEDEAIACNILEKANKVSYMMEPLYYYVQRGSSIMRSFNFKKFDIIDFYEERTIFFKERNDKDNLHENQKMEFRAIEGLIKKYGNMKNLTNEQKKKIKYGMEKIVNLSKELRKNKKLNLKFKIRTFCVLKIPKFYFGILRAIKK